MIAVSVGCVIGLARPRTLPVVAIIVGAVAVLEFVGWVLNPLPRKRKGGPGPKAKK